MSIAPKTCSLSILSLGPKGDGTAKGPNGWVYLERTAPLDQVRAKIHRDKLGVFRGEVIDIVQPSPYRQTPPCVHFDHCGNCTLQHLTPEFYQQWKLELVREAFLKVGIKPQKWLPPIFLKNKNRRRVTFTLRKNQGKVVLGYYQRRSQKISEISSCEIALPELFQLKETLKPFLPFLARGLEPIDLSFQWVNHQADMLITGPLFKGAKSETQLLSVLRDLSQIAPIGRISLRRENTFKILVEKEPIKKIFGSLEVLLPPGAFLQPTEEGELALVAAVTRALPEGNRFGDLFSGCGTFTGALLNHGEVEAFESSCDAVKALSLAGKNKHLKVYQSDLFTHPVSVKTLNSFDAVVFDPPRAGCIEQAKQMARSQCKTLIGISCNPATIARDAKILSQGGYQLKSLQVVDQFFWSHHIEVVGVFQKQR
ncbi:MAG: class I SAM-dependent RNA methyltransferase [Deltaproteobacteria bacterium]